MYTVSHIFSETATRGVLQEAVHKNVAISTRKHVRWSLFLIKLQAFGPATLLKTDSNTVVFL